MCIKNNQTHRCLAFKITEKAITQIEIANFLAQNGKLLVEFALIKWIADIQIVSLTLKLPQCTCAMVVLTFTELIWQLTLQKIMGMTTKIMQWNAYQCSCQFWIMQWISETPALRIFEICQKQALHEIINSGMNLAKKWEFSKRAGNHSNGNIRLKLFLGIFNGSNGLSRSWKLSKIIATYYFANIAAQILPLQQWLQHWNE